MFYYLPTKIYEEKDCVIHHALEMAKCGSKALIVSKRQMTGI